MILQITEKGQKNKFLTRQDNYYNFAKTKRFSNEYTILSILEYFCLYSRKVAIIKYHIMTKISEIKQQRPDRISHILIKLEKMDILNQSRHQIQNFILLQKKDLMLI